MKDITKEIKRVMNVDVLWGVDHFYLFLEKAEQHNLQISHWHNEEYWATISEEDKRIGYLWQKYPLLFIVQDKIESVKNLIEEFNYITLIPVMDLESEELIITSDQNIVDRLGVLNYGNPISATEIWFDTIN